MGGRPAGSLTRHLGALFDGGTSAGLSDRQLLERFATRRDAVGEAAFAAIVARHGPMVMSVCRRHLPDAHLAEDAFQAVFLVLARRVREVRNPEALEGWLHGVALRTSRCARNRLARRRTEPIDDPARLRDPSPTADESASRREQAEALHTAIDGLPPTFRMPVVLCYLEGLTIHEAAARLECSDGTIRSRIARAREKLRRMLTDRIPSIFAAPQVVAIPPALVHTTARAALRFASDPTTAASAATIAREILRMLIFQKLRSVFLTVLMLGGLAVGLGPRVLEALADSPAQSSRPIPRRPDEPPRPAPGRMFVVGRVVDPDGKPVAHARVMAYTAVRPSGNISPIDATALSSIGRAIADASGRFRIEADRLTSARHHRFGAVATAPGFGAGWVDLDPDVDQPEAEIRLRTEQIVQGRVTDQSGRPVAGVRVEVHVMGKPISVVLGGVIRKSTEGPYFSWSHGRERPGWPGPAIADDEGRFTLRGIGRGVRISLGVDDPRFARSLTPVETDDAPGPKSATIALDSPRILVGRVTDAETGEPIPRARILIGSRRGSVLAMNEFAADDQGRFRANPRSADRFTITAYPPPGRAFLASQAGEITWTAGATEHRVDLALHRGTVLRGRVVEEGSSRPVAGAVINFAGRPIPVGQDSETGAESGPDGSFGIAVRARPGALVVLVPSEDFVYREVDGNSLRQGQPGGRRYYVHAVFPCDPAPGAEIPPITICVRRGRTVRGLAVGPDGRPIASAMMIGRTILPPSPSAWLAWRSNYAGRVREGRFELHGLDPSAEVPVHFFDPKAGLGATAMLSGKLAANGPITVRLQPCGSARARLINREGKPIAGHPGRRLISIIITPGAIQTGPQPPRELLADEADFATIDPARYEGLVSDADGRIVFPDLIPGASYSVRTYTDDRLLIDRRDFTARPGETIDLGDIHIAGPAPLPAPKPGRDR